MHVNTLVKKNLDFLIEDAPICNADVLRDLTQCGDAKYKILVLLSFSFRRI